MFARLILIVIYISHMMACVWLRLGQMEPCGIDSGDSCTMSWIYANDFLDKSNTT